MAWGTEPSPSPSAYPSPNPFYVGNALSNLVSNYQQAQQGQQATQQNNLRLQRKTRLLGRSSANTFSKPEARKTRRRCGLPASRSLKGLISPIRTA
jgi:hypothetical protein